MKLLAREPTEAMVEAAVTAIKVEAMMEPLPNPTSIARAALRGGWDAAPAAPELTLMERVARLERLLGAGLPPA